MKRCLCVFLFIVVSLGSISAGHADTKLEDDRFLSVTISPIHLIVPMVELTGEYKLREDMGLAGVVGAGTLSGVLLGEVGAQFRYYAVGSFVHGMQFGLEVLYAFGGLSSQGVTAVASGLSIGPFIGYKVMANIGFTFEIQLGATFNVVQAQASSGGTSQTAGNQNFGLLLNINVGWSF